MIKKEKLKRAFDMDVEHFKWNKRFFFFEQMLSTFYQDPCCVNLPLHFLFYFFFKFFKKIVCCVSWLVCTPVPTNDQNHLHECFNFWVHQGQLWAQISGEIQSSSCSTIVKFHLTTLFISIPLFKSTIQIQITITKQK